MVSILLDFFDLFIYYIWTNSENSSLLEDFAVRFNPWNHWWNDETSFTINNAYLFSNIFIPTK